IKISDLSGTYTPKRTGKVTFTAGTLTIKALGTTTNCTPTNNPGASLTLDVTAPGGTSSGGSSSGGASSGGSSSGGASSGGSSSGGSSSSAGGSSSGGTSSSASGGSATGGQLPQTGPEDSAVALGTLGGTVLLAGAAGALWLTRRNQPARR
ncbi:LPXTG cell wall anchor domain-containing protein, partial [Streptomyces sp. SID161]|uniref:LPXTG cell wall anchor domain-containing protein n=1 Tax=Streptomyces sp. SID161 TaxID=2690251 RepID=UPI001369EDC5